MIIVIIFVFSNFCLFIILIHLIIIIIIIIIVRKIIIFITLIIIWNLLDQSWYNINCLTKVDTILIIIFITYFIKLFTNNNIFFMFENPFYIYSHQNIHSCKKEIIILIFLFFSLIFDMNTFLYIFDISLLEFSY
jgi:hypothetical protein